MRPPARPKPGYTNIPVYYGTSRKRSAAGYYSGEPNAYNTLGIINVSIPDVHEAGVVERPSALFQSIYNPMKYVETGKNSLMNEEQFYSAIRVAFSTSSNKGKTFIFIHGYNSTFADAARKTARLFFDMKYGGVK